MVSTISSNAMAMLESMAAGPPGQYFGIRLSYLYSFALVSGPGALPSLFKETLPLAGLSPKKMTSTVRSSLEIISKVHVSK